MEQLVLIAEPRTRVGSRAARLLRQEGRIPANIYGHGEPNVLITLDAKELTKFLEAGHRIATVRVGKKDEPGVLKEVQYDFLGASIVHVDFTRIRVDEQIRVAVPIETVGLPKGVVAGGVLAFPLKEVLVAGLPLDIPEHLPLNIEGLEIGQAIRLKDIPPPPKCTFVGDPESVIITVVHQKVEVVAAPVEAQPTQPEVIGKKKEEEPEEAAEGDAKKKEKDKDSKDKEK